MAGIETYAAYIPITRLPFAVIGGRKSKAGGPEKAVAWHDEDCVTMAVTAGANCLRDYDRSSIDGVIFATTTLAFVEKQGASIIAKALNLTGDVKTADIGGSLRSGSLAIQQAIDSVKAGSAKKILVIASDCRMGAPKTGMEMKVGDGAVALIISNDNVIAELEATASHANEMVDVWRRNGDKFVHTWEDRFINEEGYQPNTIAVLNTLLEKTGKKISDFTTACISATDARNLGVVMKALSLKPEQMQDAFFGKVGFSGAAHAPMMLVAALEKAKVGDSILVSAYGDGADASAFKVIDKIKGGAEGERRAVDFYLNRRRTIDHYNKYLTARDLNVSEYEAMDDQGISATVQFRNRDENLSLQGQICGACGTHQFPKQRVCVRCLSKDDWSDVNYQQGKGKVLTYTFDSFYPSPEPPTASVIVEIVNDDGSAGSRIQMQYSDGDVKDIALDLEVEFVFRRIHFAGKRPNYYWKCVPFQQSKNQDVENTGEAA